MELHYVREHTLVKKVGGIWISITEFKYFESAQMLLYIFLFVMHHPAILAVYQGLCSLSVKTSYRQISWSLEASRFDVIIIVSL